MSRRLAGFGALPALVVLSTVACSGDDVTFPTVPPLVMAQYCIQGQIVADDPITRNSTLNSGDCNDGGNDGYYEGWHVRVAQATTITVAIQSAFDSWLEVYRVGDVTEPDSTSTLIGEDDDSGEGLNAQLTVTLQPNTDYVIFVSGYDDSETGTYGLVIQ